MKKLLFVSLFFLLKISNTNAQSIDTDFTDKLDKTKFVQQIEAFQIKKEETLLKRRNRGKINVNQKLELYF